MEYTYDNNGNRLMRDFSWNDDNRLESVDKLQNATKRGQTLPGEKSSKKGLTPGGVLAEKEKVGAGSCNKPISWE